MTVYTFYRNKKITNNMILSAIFSFGMIILIPFILKDAYKVLYELPNISEAFTNVYISIIVIITIVTAVLVWIIQLCIIIYHSMAKYRVTSTSIISGLVLKKSIDCKKITKIICKKDFINFITPKKTLTFNLSMLKCDKHYAQSLFSFIKDNLGESVMIDNKSSELLNGNPIILSYEKSHPKIGGWLLLLFISTILSIFTYINRVLPDIRLTTQNTNYILDLIIGLGMLIFTVNVIIVVAKRKRFARTVLKIFIWCELLCSIENTISLYFVHGTALNILMGLAGAFAYIFYSLGILEYINSSVRVKNTFVN